MLTPVTAEEFTVLRVGAADPATVCGDGAEETLGFPEEVNETEFVFVVFDKLPQLDKLPTAFWSIEFK